MIQLRLLIIVVIIFILAACTNEEITIEQAMKKSNIQFDSIAHVKEMDKGHLALVFYENNEQFGLGLLKKKRNGWAWEIGNSSRPDSKVELNWSYSSLNQKLPLFYGVIHNDAIKRVVVETKDTKKEAEIIEAANRRIWLALVDKPQNPPVNIYGYDAQEAIIFTTES
ncbi:hypothetical protein D7Z26_03655 [Cohnella endophytica]|uniref:Uncharacterized protein n=1 Tax=Cohnella endophytica TaxID=2419778 RepID=A0A494Y486_9BACL|nr:hypothetical protein [Cohnella endophytica]RKP57091.1 hypothetical protein D7Z26_03655 [Cohnella endophytica]